MMFPDDEGVYARVGASPIRRFFACVVLFGLGALLIYVPLVQPPAFLGIVVMIGLGLGMLFVGEKLRRATTGELLLTDAGLLDEKGRVLAPLAHIKQVERGAFAIKPSNGFTLVLTEKADAAWQPGLWWRLGKRVGVGGVVSAGAAKFMAEQLALRLADQD